MATSSPASTTKLDDFNVPRIRSFGKDLQVKVQETVSSYSDSYVDAQKDADPQVNRDSFTKKRSQNAKRIQTCITI